MPWCYTCDRLFTTDRALEQHAENSPRHRTYPCDDCDREFNTQQGLIQHYNNSPIHDYCQYCDEHFDSTVALIVHYDDCHWYCGSCNKIFDTQCGRDDHMDRMHWYCKSCDRVFNSENNLDMHLRTSAIHNPRIFECPGQRCRKSFVSFGGLALHCESGACPSGVTRKDINKLALRLDRHHVITDPARLIAGSGHQPRVVGSWATEKAWNGQAYECIICHRTFHTLPALNAHLQSPAHASKIFCCPSQFDGCNAHFNTLSALLQHVERSTCGVTKFQKRMNNVLDDITQGMRRLKFH